MWGNEIISSGGKATGVEVDSGGTQIISAGGTAGQTKVVGFFQSLIVSSATQLVGSRGVASGTFLGDAGIEIVASGGTTIATSVGGGGLELVSSGGTANGTSVGAELLGDHGILELLGGAKTSGLKLGEGSTLIIASGFKLSGFVVNPYQILKVFAGGFASATKVTNGAEAEEDISSGGSDRRATLMGGKQFVDSGGVASGTKIASGSIQFVRGIANSATIQNDGDQAIGSGGTALNTTLHEWWPAGYRRDDLGAGPPSPPR